MDPYHKHSKASSMVEGSDTASVLSDMSMGAEATRSPWSRKTLSPADLKGLKERRGGPLGHARARSFRIVATENPHSGRWYGHPEADEIVIGTRVVTIDQLLNIISEKLKQPIRALYLESGDRVDRMEMLPSRKGIELYATERRSPPERLSVDARDEIQAAIGRASNPTRVLPPRSPVSIAGRSSPPSVDSFGTDVTVRRSLDYNIPTQVGIPPPVHDTREVNNVPAYPPAGLERLEHLSRVEDIVRSPPRKPMSQPREVDVADMQVHLESMANQIKSSVDQFLHLHNSMVRRLASERDAFATEAETLHAEIRNYVRRTSQPQGATGTSRMPHWQ